MKTFLEIEPEYSQFESSKIVIIPAPYEATTTYIKGTSKGPEAILDASFQVEDYDIELKCEPYKKIGIHTLPAIKFSKDPHADILNCTKKVLSRKKIPIFLGGEHSISFGAVKCAKRFFPNLSVLQLDAHSDLRDSYHGSKFNHACVMRRIREICHAVQVGIRSQDIEEIKYLKENKFLDTIYYAEKFNKDKINSIIKKLSNDVYITIDIDVFDPSIMPATGTPEPGGMLWDEMLAILKDVIYAKNIVGLDVVELCPQKGLHHADFMVAKLVYKIIGYLSLKL